jgi:Spy/CpxP family protein refolding chaperone
MKKNLFVFTVILLLAAGSYLGYYHFATAHTSSMLCAVDGEMEWLRHEFKLTDAQFEKIKELHAAYRPRCARMCEKIAASRASLDHQIDASQSVTAGVESAFKEYTASEEECRLGMLGHIYEVSAVMSPESRARYLQMMKEHILQPSNISHTTLRGDQHH